jgi:gliding motility associated protien GldN
MKNRIVLVAALLGISSLAFAQTKKKTKQPTKATTQTTTTKPVASTPAAAPKPKKPLKYKQDGFVFAKDTVVVEPTPYPVIKREDVLYTKRVWREVDFRDRGNKVLTSPKVNLLGVMYKAISNGELELYGIDDESFEKYPVSADRPNDKAKSMADTAFLGVNPNTNELNGANNDFFAQSFKGIRIKEDWIFDGKRGVFEPRIIGVAPIRLDIRQSLNSDGTPMLGPNNQPLPPTVTEQPVGWIYFDDLRQVLANTKIANDGNDNSGLTFDDIFTRRLFFSYITKESSSSDLRIQDLEINGRLLTDKEKLIEGERIKKKMAEFEQGLWEY